MMTTEQIQLAREVLRTESTHSLHTRKALNISTAHIPMHTNAALCDDESDEPDALSASLSYSPVDGCWFIYISEHHATLKHPEHPELEALIELAYHLRYDFLILDCDADRLPAELGYPVFEW